jgi:hypothetical protein
MGIAIVALSGRTGERTAGASALAAAAGISAYEAERHLAASGPRVLAPRGDLERALALATALDAAGFVPIVLRDDQPTPRFEVRSFAFEGRGLRVSDRLGATQRVPFAAVEVLVRGIRMTAATDAREPFLEVWSGESPVLVLRETALQYDGLHLERQPTAAANFSWLVNRLRGDVPEAVYDERLNTRAGQLRVLGDVLAPETHLEIATALVARTLRRVRSAA